MLAGGLQIADSGFRTRGEISGRNSPLNHQKSSIDDPRRLVSASGMSRSIDMDGQDGQDGLSRTGFSTTRALTGRKTRYPRTSILSWVVG